MLSFQTMLLWATVAAASTSLAFGFSPLATSSSSQRHYRSSSSSSRTALFYEDDDSKDSERAHFERNLEEAMNNDWRLFRAKLIAQEQQQPHYPSSSAAFRPINQRVRKSTPTTTTTSAAAASNHNNNNVANHNINPNNNINRPSTIQRRWDNARNRDPYTQEFNNGDATSFNSYTVPYKQQQQQQPLQPPSSASSFPSQRRAQQPNPSVPPPPPLNNLNGNNNNMPSNFRISRNTGKNGNHFFISKTTTDSSSPRSSRGSFLYSHSSVASSHIEDPFVCDDELAAFLTPQTPPLDKHRWAHPSPLMEPGNVLLANERLGGVFHQTVTLIVEDNVNGTFGIMINRPLPGNLMNMGGDTSVNIDLSLKRAFRDSCVSFGGPVWPEEFSVLHSFGEVSGARKLCPGVFIGGSTELMKQVHRGTMDPKNALFVKGHCAWEPGQLQKEIDQGVFYMASASSDFVLRYAGVELTPQDNPNDLWADILHCMGGKYKDVAARYGGYGDSRPFMQ